MFLVIRLFAKTAGTKKAISHFVISHSPASSHHDDITLISKWQHANPHPAETHFMGGNIQTSFNPQTYIPHR